MLIGHQMIIPLSAFQLSRKYIHNLLFIGLLELKWVDSYDCFANIDFI